MSFLGKRAFGSTTAARSLSKKQDDQPIANGITRDTLLISSTQPFQFLNIFYKSFSLFVFFSQRASRSNVLPILL